jgi:hypothetical protein
MTDIRYTTMGFTAATSDPVMCCILFQSDSSRGIPVNWIAGIDVTKIDSSIDPDDNKQTIIKNVIEAGAVSGGPTCQFNNIVVPCFIQYSPHGGITPTILTNCLRKMDLLNLFLQMERNRFFFLTVTIHALIYSF